MGVDGLGVVPSSAHMAMYEEAEKAFVALGYTATAAKKVVAKLAKSDPDISINDMIRKGLQML